MNKARATLSMVSNKLTAEDLHRRTANIRSLLVDSVEIQVLDRTCNAAIGNSSFETKLEPVTLTALAMAFLSGGAATALINAIRAVHPTSRDSSVEYNLDLAEEKGKLQLKATNLTRDQTTLLLEKWDGLLDPFNR
jgi:hypothetical protein